MRTATITAGRQVRYGIPFVPIIVGCALVLLIGCGTSRVQVNEIQPPPAAPEYHSDVEPRLRSEISRWKGTPHVDGGTTAAGMDCSAFVQRIYSDVFELDLPRTTRDQVAVGDEVDRDELQTGDLVFFLPPTKTRHVGIYLSEGEFAHVSSSQGVTVSELDLPYWRRAYWTSRRVLTAEPPVTVDETTVVEAPIEASDDRREDRKPAADRADGRRAGW